MMRHFGPKSNGSGTVSSQPCGAIIVSCMDSITPVSSDILDDDYENDLGSDYLGSNGVRKLLILKGLFRFSFASGLRTKQRNNRT